LARANERFARAEPLISALAPIIDICLQLGISHFELECLLRVAFVQRAAETLPKKKSGQRPSHEAIGLAVGLNRAEVWDILTKGPKGAAKRMEDKNKTYSKSDKVLTLWRTDQRYKSVNGVPLKLPLDLTPDGPSFAELVQKALPGRSPASVLKDLKRRGQIQMLSDEIVSYRRSGGIPTTTLSVESINRLAVKLRQHGDALLHSALDEKQKASGEPSIYVSSEPVKVPLEQLSNAHSQLSERILNFFQRIETEFGKPGKSVLTERVVLTIHSSKAP
jgi:hypothetical protein